MLKTIIQNSNTPIIGGLGALMLGVISEIHVLLNGANNILGLLPSDGDSFISGIIQYPFVAIVVYMSLKSAQTWAQNNKEWREATLESRKETDLRYARVIESMLDMQREQHDRAMEMLNKISSDMSDKQIIRCPFVEEHGE